jgi:LysM repeat protein
MLRRWNHLRGNSLSGRRVVYVHLPVAPGAPAAETHVASKSGSPRPSKSPAKEVTRHTVKSGETLSSIATTYRTSIAVLKRDNGNVGALRPGMVLVVRR